MSASTVYLRMCNKCNTKRRSDKFSAGACGACKQRTKDRNVTLQQFFTKCKLFSQAFFVNFFLFLPETFTIQVVSKQVFCVISHQLGSKKKKRD